MTPTPRVSTVHSEVQRRLRSRLRLVGVLWTAVVLGIVMLSGWLLAGSVGWADRTAVPLVLDVLGVVIVLAGWWALRRLGARRLDQRSVSSTMEGAAGLGPGTVQGAVELENRPIEGISTSLVDRHARGLMGHLQRGADRLQGELGDRLGRELRRAGAALALVVPVLVLLVVLSPGRSGAAWTGLAAPFGHLLGPELPPVVVQPGDAEVPRGEAVTLEIEAPLRTRVTLEWQAAGDVARTEEIEVDTRGQALHRFGEVGAAIRYRVRTPDGAETAEFRLTPVDPLFVTDVTVRLRYPEYTGLPAEEFRGDLPELFAPEGTRIEVDGRGSRDLGRADLVGPGGNIVELQLDGARFTGGWTPQEGGTWEWGFADAQGGPAALAPSSVTLSLVPDLAPQVAILEPGPDTVLPLDLRQALTLQAADDYGLRALELVAWRVNAIGETREPVRQTLDLGGVGAARARPLLDVSGWELVAGDQIRYYVEVSDVHPSPRTARTPEYVLRMPGADALRRDAREQLDETARELEELRDRANQAAETTRQLERSSQAPDRSGENERNQTGDPTGSFQEQEDIRQALTEQQQMAAETQRMAAELQALEEALRQAGASDAELNREMDELQDLMEELGGAELEERLQQLMDQMETAGDRTLEELSAEQERFQERLDETIERLKQAAVEQDLRNATQEAEDLARREQALAEAMQEGGDPQAQAEQQAALQQETEASLDRMEELTERLQEMGEQQAAEGMQQAMQAGQEAMQRMQQAQQMSQAGQQQQAAGEAGEAAEQLDEAAQALQQAQQEMMQERAEAFQRALEQATEDALALAREQAGVRDRLAGSTIEERAGLRSEVSAVREGVRNLADRMDIAQRMAGNADRELSTRLGAALEQLDRTVESLDEPGRVRRAPETDAEAAIQALNQVAMAALDAQRENSESGSASQSMDSMEQMEQLAQQQADLNNQSSQMQNMELTPQAMQQQMEQMSQQQQQIAADLGQMSNQEGEDGPLGNLEALQQEAQAIAEEMQGERLAPETRERQERLFHRLLDAGRSLEKDEETTERESEGSTEIDRPAIAGLTESDLQILQYRIPGAADLNRLSPAARSLVLRYFQRLNQGDGGAGGIVSGGAGAGGAGPGTGGIVPGPLSDGAGR